MTKKEMIKKLNKNGKQLIKYDIKNDKTFNYGLLDDETIYNILKSFSYDKEMEIFFKKDSSIGYYFI